MPLRKTRSRAEPSIIVTERALLVTHSYLLLVCLRAPIIGWYNVVLGVRINWTRMLLVYLMTIGSAAETKT